MNALGGSKAGSLASTTQVGSLTTLGAVPRLGRSKSADYIFMVTEVVNESRLCGMLMVDSGAAVNACPPTHAPTSKTTTSRRDIELQNASGGEVQHHGSETVSYNLEQGQSALVEYEVADVHAPLLSVSRMVDTGATVVFSPSGSYLHRPGKAAVPLVRKNNVF